MKTKIETRLLSLLLCIVMLVGMMPASAFAYWEEPTAEGNDSLETTVHDYTKPVGVTMKRLTGKCVTEDGNLGDDFLFVIKSGDRYYAMRDVVASEDARDTIPAVDVTDWVNEDGTLTVPADTLDVAFWRYEYRPDYEYGMFINGREDYLAYTYRYESADGDDDDYNDAERTYWGKFKIRTFVEDQWIQNPGYWSVNETSGTLHFNNGWNQRISSYNYKWHTFSMIVDLRSDGTGGKEFYFRYLGTDVKYTGEEVEGYLYYTDCRHQHTIRHAEYDAPTCMLKGCEEYWYCEGCDEYYKDEAMTQLWGENMPIIPATGHDWSSDTCANCDRPVPVYSKVTNQADFNALADDTMFILVAEYNGKYYVPDLSELYLYMMDSNGDGYPDIHDVDENGNGTPDYLEFDDNGDGLYDYLTWDMDNDGDVDEEDHLAFSEMICGQYLTDRLFNSDCIGATEVTINPDGTFSHEAVKATIEFEMVDLFLSEELDEMIEFVKEHEDWWTDDMRFTYECVKQFVVPNTFITAPSMAPEDRQYQQRIAQYGDTYSWGVLFYNDAANYEVYDYETESFINPEFHDVCTQDSVVIFPTLDNYWYDTGWARQLELLRLRDYNGEITFVTGNDYELEGSEYVEDPVTGEGYFDTHDTQAAVYLYASQQPSHVCGFGDWVDNEDGTHTGTCECGETKTEDHRWDNGTQTAAPTCTEEGVMTHTCLDCGAVKTEPIEALGHDWSDWTDHSEDSHTHTCNRNCGAEAEFEAHDWSQWTPVDGDSHKKTCAICAGERTGEHTWDEGVVTREPTEEEEGITTYTCTLCGKTKTEAIAKLPHEHDWSGWGIDDDHTHSRTCRCGETETEAHSFDDGVVTQEPTHVAEGEIVYTCAVCGHEKREELPKREDHEWGSWSSNDDGTHTRSCPCNATETSDCTYDDGVVAEEPTHTEPGVKTYTCTLCGHTYDEEIPVLTDHAWGEWVVNKEDEANTHIRYCVCNESQVEPHHFDEGVVTEEATHTSGGIKTYTCGDCGYSYTEEIPAAPEHQWTEWYANGDGTHSRSCPCNATETSDCTYDDGVVTKAPTIDEEGEKTFTCTVCAHTRTEPVDKLPEHTHAYGQWEVYKEPSSKEDGEVRRYCECGEYESDVIPALTNPFQDTKEGSYCYEPILWAAWKGITAGTSETEFSPDDRCTRAQVVTFLWRAMGEPEPTTTENPFSDVKEKSFYYKAVLWAVENGITAGTGGGKFSPDQTCTRAQVVSFLWRAMGKPEPTTTVHPFRDVKESAFYYKAMLWAVENGITAGYTTTTFAPDMACTRGQVVTFLYRALKQETPEEP